MAFYDVSIILNSKYVSDEEQWIVLTEVVRREAVKREWTRRKKITPSSKIYKAVSHFLKREMIEKTQSKNNIMAVAKEKFDMG